jgi:hypothetical protein
MNRTRYQQAKTILRALTQGLDPDTGEQLLGDTVIHRIQINRSMHTAIEALEQVEARTQRRAQLPTGVGMPWTADEEQRLAKAFGGGEPINKIAETHSRTVRAIEARLERLGLITADQRTTNNSFAGGPAVKKAG